MKFKEWLTKALDEFKALKSIEKLGMAFEIWAYVILILAAYRLLIIVILALMTWYLFIMNEFPQLVDAVSIVIRSFMANMIILGLGIYIYKVNGWIKDFRPSKLKSIVDKPCSRKK